MTRLILVSSNPKKLAEFQSFGLHFDIERGADLREVDADPETVTLYKAKAAGDGRIIEDTSLDVDGADLGTNIRWLLETLPQHVGKPALWRVMLGVNRAGRIEIYEGLIRGKIVQRDWPEDFFGFDPLFQPEGSDMTLHELAAAGRKDEFSARLQAAKKFRLGQFKSLTLIKDVPEWTGAWQKST